MVLKEHKGDKHSSRRKILASAAKKVLQQRESLLLPSNDYRYDTNQPVDNNDAERKNMEEIAAAEFAKKDRNSGEETINKDIDTIKGDFKDSRLMGFENFNNDNEQTIKIACRILGLDHFHCNEILQCGEMMK